MAVKLLVIDAMRNTVSAVTGDLVARSRKPCVPVCASSPDDDAPDGAGDVLPHGEVREDAIDLREGATQLRAPVGVRKLRADRRRRDCEQPDERDCHLHGRGSTS